MFEWKNFIFFSFFHLCLFGCRAYCCQGYKMCSRLCLKCMKPCMQPCMKRRNYVVDVLALTFALGAWISVTGFWVELPILIAHLPEGWRISSQLSVAIQLANIGPVVIGTISWLKKGEGDERGLSLSTRRCTIYSLLILGVVANILLAFEWNATIVIGGYSHSLALILLLFSVGLIGCTSPVLFMPLMAIFPQKYLVSYLVGEGLGGFLPSMVALIQGVEESSNNTNVSSISSVKDSLPLFGPTVYFLFIASVMLISTGSFFLLNNLPISKREMIYFSNSTGLPHSSSKLIEDCNGKIFSCVNETPQITEAQRTQNTQEQNDTENMDQNGKLQKSQLIRKLCYVLAIQGWINFFSSGLLPGVSTFASLPHGNEAFHLASTLGAAVVPISCLIAFLTKNTPSVACIGGVNILASMLSIYTIVMASFSPKPPLLGTTIGEALIVTNMVMYSGLSTFIKISAARICREIEISLSKMGVIKEGSGRGPLFWCGAVSQGFATIGALLDFTLVTIFQIFKSK